jgi:hypothetical protein
VGQRIASLNGNGGHAAAVLIWQGREGEGGR